MSLFRTGKRIYLDHASATPPAPAALRAAREAEAVYANPGSINADGVEAKRHLERSRERIAAQLACKPREVVFTSGLTESNALGILGAARALERVRRDLSGTHWVVSAVEHSSVLGCFGEVERMGGSVTFVQPDPRGIMRAEAVARALRKETVFVSVGWGNNEIGTIQPLARIARAIRAHETTHGTNVLLHSDAGQAPLYLSPQVHTLGVDLLSLGSGKLRGPRGIGCLFVGNRTQLAPLHFGGGQERGLRPGTENVALAAGFAAAFELASMTRAREGKRLADLRDDLARELSRQVQGLIVNGEPSHALPHMLNVSVPGQKTGEYLALQLDHAGISVSTKSACDEGEKASHVVAALGGEPWRAVNTLRFSLGPETTASHVRKAARTLAAISGCS